MSQTDQPQYHTAPPNHLNGPHTYSCPNAAAVENESLHKLGNLTIDPQSANSSKGTKGFEIKNSKYFTKAPLRIQNELEEFLPENGRWNAEAVQTRTEKIVDFAMDYWNPDQLF